MSDIDELSIKNPIAAETHIVTMGRLRERLTVLMGSGAIVGAGNKDFINAVLNGILKDIENERIKHEKAASKLERQITAHNAQANGCRAMRALVYNVVDKFAVAAEADAEIEAEIARAEADATNEGEGDDDSEGDSEYEEVEVEIDDEDPENEEKEPEPEPDKPAPSRRRRKKAKKA